jgi:membrane protein DedA with SNARE-associated domain
VGWALGSSYENVHHAFRYVDVLAVASVVVAVVAGLVLHRRRRVRT